MPSWLPSGAISSASAAALPGTASASWCSGSPPRRTRCTPWRLCSSCGTGPRRWRQPKRGRARRRLLGRGERFAPSTGKARSGLWWWATGRRARAWSTSRRSSSCRSPSRVTSRTTGCHPSTEPPTSSSPAPRLRRMASPSSKPSRAELPRCCPTARYLTNSGRRGCHRHGCTTMAYLPPSLTRSDLPVTPRPSNAFAPSR
mmetsp:Transcript_35243/g.113521  ORF Transcript_35243/g.113521 Transcript_35243/m.113521 type:complete len:201 (+) Transcript_35243:861-1463(+)